MEENYLRLKKNINPNLKTITLYGQKNGIKSK